MDVWERQWAAYDEATYDFVLSQLQPNDVVIDIGAGDLRLARPMAEQVKKVYAIELQKPLLNKGTDLYHGARDNLKVICADARTCSFPAGITLAVLLMRHCTHFGLYWGKLQAAGCRRLITNARWRTGVEIIDLAVRRRPYSQLTIGWYACSCGATGFVPGPPEELTFTTLDRVQEVRSCPACRHHMSLGMNFTNEHEFVRR
jgi:hypothetical protein